jgi:hypothetical protein
MNKLFDVDARLSRIHFAQLIRGKEIVGEVHDPSLTCSTLSPNNPFWLRSYYGISIISEFFPPDTVSAHVTIPYEDSDGPLNETIYFVAKTPLGRYLLSMVHRKIYNHTTWEKEFKKLASGIIEADKQKQKK